jgi:hypothetical protein
VKKVACPAEPKNKNDPVPPPTLVQVKAPPGQQSLVTWFSDSLTTIQVETCNTEKAVKLIDPIVSIPDSWALRIDGLRPQLIITWKQIAADGALYDVPYQTSIPYPKPEKPTAPFITQYQKGSWEGRILLADSSKIMVNAISMAEAKRYLDAVSSWVLPDKLANAQTRFGQRGGTALLEINVVPVKVAYYSKGRHGQKPDWVQQFRPG